MTRHQLRWSGLDLTPLPYESFTSVLQLFAWRNALDRRRLHGAFARPGARRIDLTKLAEETHGQHLLARYHEELASAGRWHHRCFRFCPVCLQACYHSGLFQCYQLARCPIHDVALCTCCLACGAPTPELEPGRAVFQRPYECDICHQPVAGVVPSLGAHLVLRLEQELINDRLLPYAAWWESQKDERSDIDAMLYRSRRQSQNRWCCVDDVLRSLIDHADGALAHLQEPATRWPLMTRLRWTYRVHTEKPERKPYNRGDSYVYRERVSTPTLMYRCTLMRILKWLSTRMDMTETEIVARFKQFDEKKSETLGPELLAFGMLRLQMESRCQPEADKIDRLVEFAYVDEEVWHPVETFYFRSPRIAWRAAFLALYAAWYHIALGESRGAVWKFLRSAPPAHSLVLFRSWVWCRQGAEWHRGSAIEADEAWYDGDVVFLKIPGLDQVPGEDVPPGPLPAPPWRGKSE